MASQTKHTATGMEMRNQPTSSTQSSPTSWKRSASPSRTASSPTSPRVQLIPHARKLSFDIAFTDAERLLLEKTNFKADDLSSKDFDFEDIFTFDKPQRKLPRVVEVTTIPRQRDWSNFSYSHYTAAVNARAKVNRQKSSASEMYLKNQVLRFSSRT